MAIIDTELVEDLTGKVAAMVTAALDAEVNLRCSFTWSGNTISCVTGPQFHGKRLKADGFGWEKVRQVKVKFVINNLPDTATRPAEGHEVTVKLSENGPETRYRITATKNWFDAIMELTCEDANT